MTLDLFTNEQLPELPDREIAPDAWLFHLASEDALDTLIADLRLVLTAAPLRQMCTPGGGRMSVHTSSCGELGWVTDSGGYRYSTCDPQTGLAWPQMPMSFLQLAQEYAARTGFAPFRPDACLINRYRAGARMGLHQDRDERDFEQPIVSLSLGLDATFLFGGFKRSDPVQRVRLNHGSVLVWGGASRMRYHGVAPVKPGVHERLGEQRFNLTFRKAG